MHEAPKLLVEWSSPWREFLTAIRPAMRRSPEHLAGEARVGLFPYRGMLLSWIAEAALLIAVIVLPEKLAFMHPYVPPQMPKYDIIYYTGDELPRTEDVGGAQAGRSGRAGGHEAHHRTQTIRVARGNSLREQVVDAPKLNLPASDKAVANLLAFKSNPGPPPAEGLKPSMRAAVMSPVVAPPTPQVQRDKMAAAPVLDPTVVAPAPEARPDISSLRIPGNRPVQVVPPPVSAPEQITNLNPKLTLPAPSVVAPPPQLTREIASLGPGFGPGDLHKQVVPPPVSMGNAVGSNRAVGGLGAPSVVPPTAQFGNGGSLASSKLTGLGGAPAVVAPAPSISGTGSLTGGEGKGNRGTGFGGPLDVGEVKVASGGGGGNNAGTGVVVSSQPGSKVGVPGGGGAGSLAMSPSGGDKAGLGGSGGGNGIGHGTGPGSGFSGEGPGASKEGTGRGADLMAKGGISPYPGTGGAGSGAGGKPNIPGVSVHGGSSNVINLPSFGSDPGSSPSSGPGRSSVGNDHKGPSITIEATSRSGGAFNFYGQLKGDKVYTIYIDTVIGTAVMQFADPTSAGHAYSQDLASPEPLRTDMPAKLPPARLVVACILDREGQLRNPHVLETESAVMTSKVLAALSTWKFRPVTRGEQPVEVNAILGFNIDTR